MAQELEEGYTGGQGECNIDDINQVPFVFEEWILENGLLEIKYVLQEMEICSLDSLKTDNANFAKLISDDRILSKPHLIPNIVHGIKSLNNYQDSLKNLHRYQEKLETICTERQLFGDYELQRKIEMDNINKYQLAMSKKLDIMTDSINANFKRIDGEIAKKRKKLTKKMNLLKKELKQFIMSKHNDIKYYDKMLQELHLEINEAKDFYNTNMKLCNDMSIKTGYNDYRIKLQEIVDSAKKYDEDVVCKIDQYLQDIMNFIKKGIDVDIAQKFTNKSMDLIVDNFIYKDICQDLQTFIYFKSMGKYSQKPNSKTQKIKELEQKNKELLKKIREYEAKMKIDDIYIDSDHKMNDEGCDGPSEKTIKWRINQIEIAQKMIGFQNLIKVYPQYVNNNYKDWKFDFPMVAVPEIMKRIGKKRWLGYYRKWREFLHKFDSVHSLTFSQS